MTENREVQPLYPLQQVDLWTRHCQISVVAGFGVEVLAFLSFILMIRAKHLQYLTLAHHPLVLTAS